MNKLKPADERQPAEAVESLMTYQEAAKVLGITDRTLWELVRKGELRNVRVGRSVRIDPADLRQFIEDSKSS
ncbi:MAG: helix-turn-helix domain-containing protein [Phycisphaeraceae bacterium]